MGVQLCPPFWSVTLVRRLRSWLPRSIVRDIGPKARPSYGPRDGVKLCSRLQNSIAVLAVMAAIALLAVTLVVPRKSLLLVETPATYANAK
jgi:hypothetical protein